MIPDDLTEARAIVAELGSIEDELRPGDARFLRSWRMYLGRRGDTAAIGPNRLTILRRVLALYVPDDAGKNAIVMRGVSKR